MGAGTDRVRTAPVLDPEGEGEGREGWRDGDRETEDRNRQARERVSGKRMRGKPPRAPSLTEHARLDFCECVFFSLEGTQRLACRAAPFQSQRPFNFNFNVDFSARETVGRPGGPRCGLRRPAVSAPAGPFGGPWAARRASVAGRGPARGGDVPAVGLVISFIIDAYFLSSFLLS